MTRIKEGWLRRGDWVVQTRGRYKGRTGRIDRVLAREVPSGEASLLVQFGSGGPFEKLSSRSVEWTSGGLYEEGGSHA